MTETGETERGTERYQACESQHGGSGAVRQRRRAVDHPALGCFDHVCHG